MARTARVVIPGILHHITQRGNRREDVFYDDEDKFFFMDRLLSYSARAGLLLASHCLMTNHTHLLAVPEEKDSLERTFKPLHLVYSQYLNKRFNRTGINWQGRYFSSPLDDEHSWYAFQYVALNPVKADIVSNFQEYSWSSARDLLSNRPQSALTAGPKWLSMGHDALAQLLDHDTYQPNEVAFEHLEKMGARNLPVGSDDFIARLEKETGRTLRPKPIGRPRKVESR